MSLWSRGRYQAVGTRIAGIAAATVAAAGPLAGRRVVDLACGTGNAALAAADAGARVTAVDLTPELIALGAEAAGARPIDWVVADAADTGLPAASFDAAVSNMGIIFVDPRRQLDEIARLLKPGGALAFSAWVRTGASPLQDPVTAVFGPPPDTGFSPEQWGDPDIVAARLSRRFTDLAITAGVHRWEFDSLAAAMHFITDESPMHVAAFERADDEQRARLSAGFEAALRAHADPAGAVSFDSPYLVISAARAATD